MIDFLGNDRFSSFAAGSAREKTRDTFRAPLKAGQAWTKQWRKVQLESKCCGDYPQTTELLSNKPYPIPSGSLSPCFCGTLLSCAQCRVRPWKRAFLISSPPVPAGARMCGRRRVKVQIMQLHIAGISP